MLVTLTYLLYLAASIGITVWAGYTLSRNGRVFLVENFQGNAALADSINHLLLVGFYLINLGFISIALQYGQKPIDINSSIEYLSTKIGLVAIILGIMHFFNMRALVKFRHFKWHPHKDAACIA